MALFHTHSWKVVSTDYTEPLGFNEAFYSTGYVKVQERLMSGTTHIYMKCETCGDIKQKDVVGKFLN